MSVTVDDQGGSQTLASFFGGSGSGSRTYPRANSSSPFREGESAPAPADQLYEEDQPAFISVSTSYAAGVSTSLPNTSDVEQLAASIGFGVTEDDLVGLELGSTSYSYTRTSSLTEQTGASVSRMAMVNDNGDDDGKLASPTPTTGSYETTEFVDQQRAFSVWGTAFYERRLLNIESFSLLGRAGAGVATDGVVGYGRVTSELALGSAISLVVGAEARAMPFRLGPIQGTGSSKAYGTVFTALTGLHVRF